MTVNYRGIEFNIVRKCTNNIVIKLYVDSDTVSVTAPFTITETELKNFLSVNAATIKEARQRLDENADELIDYFSDYYIDVLGEQHELDLCISDNSNSFDNPKHKIVFTVKASSSRTEQARYIKRKYNEFLHEKTDDIIRDTLKILNKDIENIDYNWNTETWVDYDNEKGKMNIHPQITTRIPNYLRFVILDAIMKDSHFSDDAYKDIMNTNVRGWKGIQKWCTEHTPVELVRRKTKESIILIDSYNFKEIKETISRDNPDCVISIQSIMNLSCDKESECGILSCFRFDAVVLCEHETKPSMWYKIPCEKSRRDFSTGKVSEYYPKISKSDNKFFPEEFVPPIPEEDYEAVVKEILKKNSPSFTNDNVPVPIRKIAEESGLKVIEFVGLKEKLNTSCITVWGDCNITDKEGNIIIKNAKQGEVYVDGGDSKEEINSCIAGSYYHWHLHKSAFSCLYTGERSNESTNKCIFDPIDRDSQKTVEQMTAYERALHMSFCMAATSMVPSVNLDEMLKPVIKKIEEEGSKYISFDALIDLLSKHYKTGRVDIKRRLLEKGIRIESTGNAEKRKSVLYDIIINDIKISENSSNEIKCMNDSFSATLNQLIKSKRSGVGKARGDKQNGGADIAGASGISEHTLSRMRNRNGMEVSLQMILGVCCGLNLSVPETEMLLDKSPFRLQPSIREHYVYKLVMPLFKCYDIIEINDILEHAGVRKIGASKDKNA